MPICPLIKFGLPGVLAKCSFLLNTKKLNTRLTFLLDSQGLTEMPSLSEQKPLLVPHKNGFLHSDMLVVFSLVLVEQRDM